MFSTMVSGDVLEYLKRNPEAFSLAGEARDATMFFSSIHGFVPIAEKLDPRHLFRLVNRVLSPMTDIIIDSQGYVDKYEGDTIMAVWGVPRLLPDHARLACWSALECQEKLLAIRPELEKEFGVDVRLRMGLNSGQISAGNMGSSRRFSYTVMGEAVNQAARLEPANKDYGTAILIGQATYEAAQRYIEARLLDLVVMKGRPHPLRVYELVSKKGQLASDMHAVLELFGTGLNLHWERDWDGALKCFESALRIRPSDGPSMAMANRVRSYKDAPQNIFEEGGAWDGVFRGIHVRLPSQER